MTTEELGNYQLQKQFVKLFWDLLSRKDESKILLDVKVGDCKSLEDFLKLFSRYRVNLNIKIQDLEKNGVKVEPKVFLLTSADPLLEKKGDKKKRSDHDKHTSDEKNEKTPREKKLKTEFTTVLDPNIKPCEACGRQEKDRMLKVNHTFANCYLKSHPDANKDPKTPWKDSKNGKAYAAHMGPSSHRRNGMERIKRYVKRI